jgi:Lrp/AsnC family transcriptional regulator for asnA, asnC and gidA
MIKIDEVDKQISDLLIEDGRMSCAKIAQRIGKSMGKGISERAVRYRIDRLIKNGVIDIHGNVNADALGLVVCADVFIEVDPDKLIPISETIAESETVSYLAYSTGNTDISIQLFARDNNELFKFVTEHIGKIPGVRKTHISFVPIKLKDDKVWHIPASCVKN